MTDGTSETYKPGDPEFDWDAEVLRLYEDVLSDVGNGDSHAQSLMRQVAYWRHQAARIEALEEVLHHVRTAIHYRDTGDGYYRVWVRDARNYYGYSAQVVQGREGLQRLAESYDVDPSLMFDMTGKDEFAP